MTTRSFLRHLCLKASLPLGLMLMTMGQASAATTLSPDTFKVGIEVAYPPFESWQNGKVVGFDAELAALISQQLGSQPQFIDTQFSGLILGLNANKYDAVISASYITEARKAQVDAIPYAQTGAYILVKGDSETKPADTEALCGLTVGLQSGTAWVNQLKVFSDTTCKAKGKSPIAIQEYPTAPETLQALMSNHVQAQVDMAGTAQLFAERTRGRVVISSPTLIYPQTLGIYVKKGNQALSAEIRKALDTLRSNGEYASLLAKYQPYGITDTSDR